MKQDIRDDQKNRKKIVFLVNPVAGTASNKMPSLKKAVLSTLDQNSFSCSFVMTDSPEMLAQEARKCKDTGIDIVVAVGGDGTINIVSGELKNSDVVLAIIPDGSGNGLARHLGLPLRLVPALKIINANHHITIDTAMVNDRYFVSLAGIGFDALVAAKYKKTNKRGLLPYIRTIFKEYPGYKPNTYALDVDGQEIKVKALFIAFANSSQFGYNTMVSPTAKLTDGLLDVIIFRKVPIIKLPTLLAILFHKKADQSGFTTIIRGKEIFVNKRKKRMVNIDGEAIKTIKKLHVRMEPLSLKVIVPDNHLTS